MSDMRVPPRVSFFQEAGELFLGQFTRNAERASAPDFAFTGHLNYANTLLSDFLLTVAGTKVDALQLNGIMLIDELGDMGAPERFSELALITSAMKDGTLVRVNEYGAYPYSLRIVSGRERLPTAVPDEDARRNNFSRGQLLDDDQCTALLGLIQRAEADISDHRKLINRPD
ncbi:MAG TPA: hypothetical protein PKD20_01560 [Candidatus Saccharibacteria bacterium]|jgi:hypothetical protein|nr:hypothetical protein [Candidatus Saccharibacteria bacterium]HMT55545.1 hypothetical protein [Candidatus Saccharibacteria bacterium]